MADTKNVQIVVRFVYIGFLLVVRGIWYMLSDKITFIIYLLIRYADLNYIASAILQ